MKQLAAVAVLAALLAGCGAQGPAPMSPAARAAQMQALAKKGAKIPAAELAKAAKWVAANSGGSFWDDPRKHLFPAGDDGNNGTTARAYGGAEGQWMADLAHAWFQGLKRPPQFAFDPQAHLMVVVETSDDEPVLIVALYERQTGKGRVLGEMAMVDVGYDLPQAAFARFFPTLGAAQDVDYFLVMEAIAKRGTAL